ncbi:GCN5-like 1 [Thamnocephalis sphaerospora]|uniref:Biogenesis of lysosome-related organelles complex 1 subunit 1 n=1 Tax=Thamnocephalis sphaerospora TaxID=78915 RepID=A0A4P9XTH9_9FUNG|nr:GCN5-like 1 [Thamnocephalis sphaerospora]|eukprot:RKP08740.1 GCN5-like 1 [Thamnocephalis sphaerospora]
MYSKLLKEHASRQTQQRKENDHRRREAIQALGNYTDALADTLNAGVSMVFTNERQLQQQARMLNEQTERCVELTNQWLEMSKKLNGALKELGMVGHYCKVIEGDAREMAETLRLAKERAPAHAD